MKTFLIIFGIFLAFAGVGVGLYFYLKPDDGEDKKDDENPKDESAGNGGGSGSSGSGSNSGGSNSNSSNNSIPADFSSTKELKKGSEGAEVKSLQGFINKTINAVRVVSPLNVPEKIGEDGEFGTKTEKALLFCTDKKTITLATFSAAVRSASSGSRMDLTTAQKDALKKSAGGNVFDEGWATNWMNDMFSFVTTTPSSTTPASTGQVANGGYGYLSPPRDNTIVANGGYPYSYYNQNR